LALIIIKIYLYLF